MRNKINIENYEAFLLDYMEGTISTEDLVSLQIFAAQHPHLSIDLNELELVELESEKIAFEQKQDLKKISDAQFVAYIENELGLEEKQNIETLCSSNQNLATELNLYKKTLLAADEAIVFENKSALKRNETKVLWLFSREVLAAAASLILVVGLWFVFKGVMPTDNLNSEKIDGIKKQRISMAFRSNPAPSFTITKAIEVNTPKNPIAYTNSKNNMVIKEENNPIANLNTPKKDTSANKGVEFAPILKTDQLTDNSTKLAINQSTNKTYVITEKAYDEDEKIVASNTKKGFWNKAMNALNSLNKLGVKKAKGVETVEYNNEQHVLTMGNFKVENHRYNAE